MDEQDYITPRKFRFLVSPKKIERERERLRRLETCISRIEEILNLLQAHNPQSHGENMPKSEPRMINNINSL